MVARIINLIDMVALNTDLDIREHNGSCCYKSVRIKDPTVDFR